MSFPPTCSLCPRLVDFRVQNRAQFPDWHNAPVPSFGELDAALLVVGLAPGLRGANCTGRPFTGDYAGIVLYPALLAAGFASGTYDERPDDGLALQNCRITNAVRCVPPENKPTTDESRTCRTFLVDEMKEMPTLKVILSLGQISHKSVSVALGFKQSSFAFAHGALHRVESPVLGREVVVLDSYHCSRYNINTGRLTQAMFEEVVEIARGLVGG